MYLMQVGFYSQTSERGAGLLVSSNLSCKLH